MKVRFLLAFLAVLLATLLCCLAHGQQFSGQSGGNVRVIPPYRACLGPDNGTDACAIQNGANKASFIGSLDITGTLTCAGVPCVSGGGGSSALPVAIYNVALNGFNNNGTTDNTSAVQALLSTVGSNPSTLLFPAGTYAVGNVTFPANVTLDFSAGGSIKPLTSSTSPGGAAFVNGTGAECGSAASCTTSALAVTAGNTLVVLDTLYPGFTFLITSVTDSCGDAFAHVQQSLAGQTRNSGAWVASNAIGGSCTFTATANGTLTTSQVIAQQYSGLGPIVVADGAGANSITSSTTMSSGSVTTTAGSLLIGYGGQPFTTETVTAGAGYTQPAGTAGQTPTGYLQAEYNLSSAGGSTSATATLTAAPSNAVYSVLALKPGSASIIVKGGIVNPNSRQIFTNATGTAGTIDFTGNLVLDRVQPEWWGASPSASAAINTPALQAAEHGAFGTGRTNGTGLSIYNKPLLLSGNYQINAEITFYDVLNFKVKCDRRLSGGITQNTANLRIIDGQSIAYGSFDDCSWGGVASSTNALIDLDYNGVTTAGDLAPQFIDFNRNNFGGSSLVDVGVLIAKSGGTAQGSNIYCYDCVASGFTGAAWQIGGDNTGRNVGRFGATNAIDIGWYGGDMQGNPLYGLASYWGGEIFLRDVTFENGFVAQTGFDMACFSQVGTEPCVIENSRSESRRLITGGFIRVVNSYTVNQASSIVAGTSSPTGTIYIGSTVGGDGQYYTVSVNGGAPGFGGLGSIASPVAVTSGSATTIVNSGAAWTVNAFNGMIVSVMAGTNIGCYGVATSNTATAITMSGGWLTKYSGITCGSPDATSTFLVEPGWNGGTVVSGTMTLVALNEKGIDGANGNVGFTGTLENVSMPGERINAGYGATLRNVTVTRSDWLPSAGGGWWQAQSNHDWDVHLQYTVTDSGSNIHYQNWAYTGGPAGLFNGPFQRNMGTTPFIWSVGNGGSLANVASDVWIGGRSDPFSTNSVSRAVLEYGGILGRATPTGTNQNGTATQIQGGLPTGSGTPGTFDIWNAPGGGGSGAAVQPGVKVASFGYGVLNIGPADGAVNGTLGLVGKTSGTATFTAPAVAATSTNAIAVSNVLAGPDGSGTSPTYGFSSSANTGMFQFSGTLALKGTNINIYNASNSLAFQFANTSGNLGFFLGKGQHINTQAANNDLAGTVATASATTASVVFTTNYTAAPVCVLTPQTTGLTSWYLSAISVSGFTVTVAPSGTYTFGYICVGNPN